MLKNAHYPLVKSRDEREDESVPGPFYVVKDACIICELPLEIAPKNFDWDSEFVGKGCVGCPDHCRVIKQPTTQAELEKIIEAAVCSCVSAIRYCGTDRWTIERFREAGEEGLCDAVEAGE